MSDKKFEKLQEETVELIKNKKGNKKMKAPKEVKTYTLKQIIKTTLISLALIAAGATAGITIYRAIGSTINSQVKSQTAEQIKAFTVELEAKQ